MANIEEIYLTDYNFKEDYSISNGDIELISGLEKIKEGLFRRLITKKGSMAYRPQYGVGIEQYRNAPATLSQRRKLANEVNENFKRDPHVKKIKYLEIQYEDDTPETMVIILNVELIGLGEQTIKFIPFGE